MENMIRMVGVYIRAIWYKRWYCLLIAILISFSGWIFVYTMPDQYEASAKVHIDTRSLLRPLLKGIAVDTDPASQVNYIVRNLLTGPNIEKIIRKNDLHLTIDTDEAHEHLVNRLKREIKIVHSGGYKENTFVIKYVHKDRLLALSIVQTVVSLLQETILGDTRSNSSDAQRFLDQQIEEYEFRLQEKERALKEFKRRNVGKMPTEGVGYYQRLESEKNKLKQAELELLQLRSAASSIRRQLATEESKIQVSEEFLVQQETPELMRINAQIDAEKQALQNLLLRYTELHPDVVNKKSLIAGLEQRRKVLEKQAKRKNVSVSYVDNPNYQLLKASLSAKEQEIAAQAALVSSHRRSVAELGDLVEVLPDVEEELAGLNRDYNVIRSQYSELIERRESAKIAQEREASGNELDFREIEPPKVPLKPSGPHRILLSTAAFALSMVAGVFFGFFLALLKQTVNSHRDLMQLSGLPVLGIVTKVVDRGTRVRRTLEVMLFMLGFIGYLAAFGCVIAFYTVPEFKEMLRTVEALWI